MPEEVSLSLHGLYNLQGRIALVTGGGSGIGRKIAEGLAANGAKVYISSRRIRLLDEVAAAFDLNKKGAKGSVHSIQMDVTDKESIMHVVNILKEREGKLHILVNNSGQVGPVSKFWRKREIVDKPLGPEAAEEISHKVFDNETFQEWSDLFSVNTSSIFFTTMAFVGLLTRGAADDMNVRANVINITSISGKMRTAQQHFAYNSSKAAASHLTRMFATEFALKGIPIRVNAIAPGVFESEMTSESITSAEETNAIVLPIVDVPAGRPGRAQEIVGTTIYLVTPAGAYANGTEIPIDGGYFLVNPSVGT